MGYYEENTGFYIVLLRRQSYVCLVRKLTFMKTITLLFDTKKQLFEFYFTLGEIAFAIDVSRLIITSAFSPTDVLIAVLKHDARVLTSKSARFVTEENTTNDPFALSKRVLTAGVHLVYTVGNV